MSRILPIKNGLDDRFINQTDVITENALEQVINGQGVGGGYIESTADWAAIPYMDPYGDLVFPYSTKEEACAVAGITISEWEALMNGELKPLKIHSSASPAKNTPALKALYSHVDLYERELVPLESSSETPIRVKQVMWTGSDIFPWIGERDGHYVVSGFYMKPTIIHH